MDVYNRVLFFPQHMGSVMYLRVLVVIFLLATFGLSGCSSTPSSTTPLAHPPSTSSQALDALANMPKRKRAEFALAWAEQYLDEQRYTEALAVLKNINPAELTNTDYKLRWYQMTVHALLSEEQVRQASLLLDEPELKNLLKQQDSSMRATFELRQADVLALEGKIQPSLQLRFQIDPLLNNEDQHYNQQLIWQLLNQLTEEELNALADNSSLNGRGWVELMQLYKNETAGLEEQIKRLHQWQRQWSQHAAFYNPPEAITSLELALKNRPRHIAILLPEHGGITGAAYALRNGILTSYFYSAKQNHDTPELRFYDSSDKNGNIIDIYQAAVDAGAELVIGPLEKEKVLELSRQKTLPVEVLSLNYHDQEDAPSNLLQFGLSPEDEAEQAAELAYSQGFRHIGLLFPDNTTGERTAYAFQQAWTKLGGEVIDQVSYQQDISNAVSRLLKVDTYQARTQRKKNVSRKDIDSIFVVANAEQGRQIKPTIDFYHGNQLPIFSTAMIYDAQPNRQQNSDLNRIQFVDMPWLINPDPEFAQAVIQAWPNRHGRYERIFALGADAYQLSQQLALMRSAPHNLMHGLTGTLTLKQQRIHRSLLPVKFVQGEAIYNASEENHVPSIDATSLSEKHGGNS